MIKAHLHLPRLLSGIDEVISVAPMRGAGTSYFGTVILKNVTFKVSPSGRKRTLDSRRRNVHAWVVGDKIALLSGQKTPIRPEWKQAYYNPYTCATFIDKDTGDAIYSAEAAYMVGSKVYYL